MILKPNKTLNLNGKIIDLSTPVVMGILNITPDSFFDGGYYEDEKKILLQVEKMLTDGATIIDIGGASSKPNAMPITHTEELRRIINPLKSILKEFPSVNISIDTNSAVVAKITIETGAGMINDISGGDNDAEMYELLAEKKIPYIMMHSRGNSQTMTTLNHYDDLIPEIITTLQLKINRLKSVGVNDIIADPGFGFAKNISQNYQILNNLSYFKHLNVPLMVGISRKSMIYKTIHTTPQEALNGTTVLNTIALINGADILRVHDVKEAIQCIKLVQATYI